MNQKEKAEIILSLIKHLPESWKTKRIIKLSQLGERELEKLISDQNLLNLKLDLESATTPAEKEVYLVNAKLLPDDRFSKRSPARELPLNSGTHVIPGKIQQGERYSSESFMTPEMQKESDKIQDKLKDFESENGQKVRVVPKYVRDEQGEPVLNSSYRE